MDLSEEKEAILKLAKSNEGTIQIVESAFSQIGLGQNRIVNSDIAELEKRGEIEIAQEVARVALENNPGNIFFIVKYGSLLLKNGNLSRAEEFVEEYKSSFSDTDHPPFRILEASVHKAFKRYYEAILILERLEKTQDTLDELAELYYLKDEIDKAKELLESRRLSAGGALILAKIYEQEKAFARALEVLRPFRKTNKEIEDFTEYLIALAYVAQLNVSGRASILLAEDDKSLGEAIAELLIVEGYSVTQVGDGEIALQKLETEPIDLLIADLRMPKLGGKELIREIREQERNGRRFSISSLEIVVFTAHPMEFDERQAWREYNVFDYITKPVENEPLLRCVAHSLDRKKMREEALLHEGISSEMLHRLLRKVFAPDNVDFVILARGFSKAVVATVMFDSDYGRITRIVKIDTKESIDKEIDNDHEIKRTNLPSFHYSNIIGTWQLSVAISAIVYEPVNWKDSIIPFRSLYRDAPVAKICLFLENMLSELTHCWYMHQESTTKPLFESDYQIGMRERTEILITIDELGKSFLSYLDDWGKKCVNDLSDFLSGNPVDGKDLWQWKIPHRECLTHGNLNSSNFFIDAGDAKLRTWFLIDFAYTEPTHYMMDFAKLEAEVKFFLMDNWIADNLDPKRIKLWLEFEDLLGETAFGDTPSFPTNRRNSSDVRKAYEVISRIRSRAAKVVNFNERDYYIALLYHTLMVLRYSQEFRNVIRIKKIFALYCANLLLDKLLSLCP